MSLPVLVILTQGGFYPESLASTPLRAAVGNSSLEGDRDFVPCARVSVSSFSGSREVFDVDSVLVARASLAQGISEMSIFGDLDPVVGPWNVESCALGSIAVGLIRRLSGTEASRRFEGSTSRRDLGSFSRA